MSALAQDAPEPPAEEPAPFPLAVELDRTLEAVRALDASSCVPTLEGWYTTLEALAADDVDMAEVSEHARPLIDTGWQLRLALHERLSALAAADELDDDCLRSIRRVDGANRYMSDYLYEMLPEAERDGGLLVNPDTDFESLVDSLHDGDVLVTRGTWLSSAGIAHMGQIDAQFSHNVLVHRPGNAGEVKTVEAYMEYGGISQSLPELLEHGVGRVVVLRYEDPAVAAEAARIGYERMTGKKKVFYDDAFEYDDPDRLFCSEVPRWAFGAVEGGPQDVPRRLSVYATDTNPALYRAMGIHSDITSAPSDILYDPRFTYVAEWRDVPIQRELRRHDATVEALFTWMEDLDYELEPGPPERNMVGVGLFIRRTPLLGLALKNSLHPKASRDFLVTSLALQNAGKAVYAELEARLAGREDLITWPEMRELLEQIRTDDLATWRSDPGEAAFHRLLHPRE